MAEDGLISKAAFDKCIRGMVPASLLDTEEKTAFSVLLSSIFFSFDRDNRWLENTETNKNKKNGYPSYT